MSRNLGEEMSFRTDIKVLVVDDMRPMRKLVISTLSSLGLTIFKEAEDGDDALEMILEEGDYGLIVADWNMPRMTGLELLKKLRKKYTKEELPFLMVTAEGDTRNVMAAMRFGVSSYILKPFTKQAMQNKLEKILRGV